MNFSEERWAKFRARIFKALGDVTRLKIIRFLHDGEKCVCEIGPHVGQMQPVVSRHLKILKDCGIVQFRKDGNRRLYSLTDPKFVKVLDSIDVELTRSLSQRLIEKMIPV
jgi:DNA-binding transcriptional ArsR family regulator